MAEDDAQDEIEALLADAADDEERLRRLAVYISEHHGRMLAARAERNRVAGRMREQGVSMQVIARLARVDDSYLARVLLNTGMEPRLRRGGRAREDRDDA